MVEGKRGGCEVITSKGVTSKELNMKVLVVSVKQRPQQIVFNLRLFLLL